jgi:hypothetical protein
MEFFCIYLFQSKVRNIIDSLNMMNKALGFILLLTMTTSGYGYDRITGEKFASRSEVIGTKWHGCNQSSACYSNWFRHS